MLLFWKYYSIFIRKSKKNIDIKFSLTISIVTTVTGIKNGTKNVPKIIFNVESIILYNKPINEIFKNLPHLAQSLNLPLYLPLLVLNY